MKSYPMLQAHRGVCTEAPENTLASFRTAIAQGYEYIELDPSYTADGQIVVLHDKTLNRTARKCDGSPVSDQPIKIREVTLDEARKYDYGVFYSVKFKGESIPLLEDVLALTSANGVRVKIDNKILAFPDVIREKLYDLLDRYEDLIAMTAPTVSDAAFFAKRFKCAEIHYDGAVTPEVLRELSPFASRLTVWLPYKSQLTSWVKVPFADKELCQRVKDVARLGIWIINDEKSFDEVCYEFSPDIVETTGIIKPYKSIDGFADMHVHSENSHDGKCSVEALAKTAESVKIKELALTDHCDIQYYHTANVAERIKTSVAQAKRAGLLKGVEIGESIWDTESMAQILEAHSYDVVIGSVHAVRVKGYSMPYSQIDFAAMDKNLILTYLDKYFDEVMETLDVLPMDVLAHLTCPLRYIIGKYGIDVDISVFDAKIDAILKCVIKRGIALEINTSSLVAPLGETMPSESIVKRYKEMGGYLITLGSDAHICENISVGFIETARKLKELGFKNCYYYANRCAMQYSLDEI